MDECEGAFEDMYVSVGSLPVSKWELKAKLGLKNAEDMAITCRANIILLRRVGERSKKHTTVLSGSGNLSMGLECAACYSTSIPPKTIPLHLQLSGSGGRC